MIKLHENFTCWNTNDIAVSIIFQHHLITHGFHAQRIIFSLFKTTNKEFTISF